MRPLFAVASGFLLNLRVLVSGQAGVTGEGFEFDGDDVTVPFSATPSAPTPLWRYVLDGNAMGVEALLAAGAAADIEVRDHDGHTPLTYTSTSGRLRIVTALLGAGADMAAHVGSPPLVLASRAGHLEMLQALLDNGADPEGVDFNNLSALWHAARLGSFYMVEACLDAGATMEHRDYQNNSPLSWAALQGRADIAQLLLDRGADPGILNELIMDRIWAHEVGCITKPQYDAVAEECPSAFTGRTLRDYTRADMVQMLEDAIASRRLSGSSRGKAVA